MSGKGDPENIDPARGHMGISRKDQYEQEYRMVAMARYAAWHLVRGARLRLLEDHVCVNAPTLDAEWLEIYMFDCAAVRERSVAEHYHNVSEHLIDVMKFCIELMFTAFRREVERYKPACCRACTNTCTTASCQDRIDEDPTLPSGSIFDPYKTVEKIVKELLNQRRNYPEDVFSDYCFNITVQQGAILHRLKCHDAKFGTNQAAVMLNPELKRVQRKRGIVQPDRQSDQSEPNFVESAVSFAYRVEVAERELSKQRLELKYALAGEGLLEDMHKEFTCKPLCGPECNQSCLDESGSPRIDANMINRLIADALLAHTKEADIYDRVMKNFAPLLTPLLQKVKAVKCLSTCTVLAKTATGSEEFEERRRTICANTCHKHCSPGCAHPCLPYCEYSLDKGLLADSDKKITQFMPIEAILDDPMLRTHPLLQLNGDLGSIPPKIALNSYVEVLCPGMVCEKPTASAALAMLKDDIAPTGIIPINSVPNVGTAAAAGGMAASPVLQAAALPVPQAAALPLPQAAALSATPSQRFKRLAECLEMKFAAKESGELPEPKQVAERLALLVYCENVENCAELHASRKDSALRATLSRAAVSAQLDAELARAIQAAKDITGPHSPLLDLFVARLHSLHELVCKLNVMRPW